MKKITHSLVAMFALIATTAFAVDPVAVWVGNQMTTESTQNGITINLNGNTCSDGVVTIASGIDISKSSGDFAKAITVIAEIEDMPTDASDSSRKTIFCCKVAGNDLTLDSVSNGKFMCDWNHGTHGSSAKSTDTIPSGKHIVAFAYDGGNKTGVKAYVDGTQKVSAGLFTSNTNIDKFFIGSYKNGMCVTSGMKVSKIAVFSSMLSAADVAAYEFPNPDEIVLFDSTTQLNYNVKTRISPDTSITMEQLRASTFSGKIGGGWMPAGGIATRCVLINEAASTDDKLVIQLQVFDDREATHYIKFANVELTVESDGVYAKHIHRGYVQTQTDENIGTLQTGGTSLDNQAADVYAVIALKATWEKPADKPPLLYCFHLDGNADNAGMGTVTRAINGTANYSTDKKKFGTGAYSINNGVNSISVVDTTNGLVDFENGWTLSLWVNPNNMGTWKDFGGFDIGNRKFKFERTGSNAFAIYQRHPNDNNDDTQSTIAYNNNADEWINIILVASPSGSVSVYKNGTLNNAFNISDFSTITQKLTGLYIGVKGLIDENSRVSTAIVDEVAVYGTVLTASQIAYLQENAPDDTLSGGSSVPTVEVDCGTEYSMSDANAVEGSAIVLKFDDAGGTFLINEAPSRKYTIKCAGMVEIIADGYTLTAAELSKLTFTQVAGGIALGGGEYEVSSKVANSIEILRDATVKINHGNADALNGVKILGSGLLVFNGNGNGGDLLNIVKCSFDASWTGTVELNHYTGGNDRTAFLLGNANSFVRYVNCEGWLRSNSDPQVAGATGHEMNVELVDNGGTGLKIINGWSGWNQTRWIAFNKLTGTGTLAYNWTAANPGNPIIVRDLSEFEGAFTMTIPADKCGAIIVSPTATYETISQADGNGKIVICADGVANVAKGKTWTAVNGIVVNGTIGGEGTLGSATTFGEDATLDLDKGALSVTGTLTLPSQIKLAVTNPEHAMTVLNVPAGFTTTSCKALVGDKVCDLFLEGTALKLKWKIPPTIELEADDVTIETADDWNGGVVTIDIGSLTEGDYKNEIAYFLKFGDKTVTGSAANGVATFELSADDFTAGNIYRGTFELGYGDAGDTITAADVIVYEGKLTYVEKNPWVNETPDTDTFKTTGSYNPESGVSVVGDMIQINTNKEVTFTPKPDPDYVDKCDSSFTIQISADEAIDAGDNTVEDGAQAGVQIVADDEIINGVKFQFIVGDEWVNGPKAALNTLYDVTISFHYAKEEGDKDSDSVTYTVKDLTQEPVVAERRENTANKVEEIIFYDGTQFASLVGTCQIEKADPVPQGMEPGAAEKELKATDETAAQIEAGKIPVLVPSEIAKGLADGADEATVNAAKESYKANFKVVAQKNASGKFVAIVVPTADAAEKAEKEVQKVSTDVLAEVTALTGDQTEGTATISEAVPGFFYGVAENGEVVNMKTAEPEEWKMAGASGKVKLKVTKPANAKARFYKIICTPVKPATK